MINNIICPKCSKKTLKESFWETKDNRLKCKNCLYIFTLKPNPLNIPNNLLKQIISEFLLEHSTNIILERINVSKYKLLKILFFLRILMVKDIAKDFKGIIKLNSENFEIDKKINNPIIGIFYSKEKIFAKILTNINLKELKDFTKNQTKNKLINYPEEWKKNIGLVYRNHFYKIYFLEKNNIKNKFNVLETFWGYLKKKLTTKGGIRKEKLPLFLAEYVWRYNNRKLTLKQQEEKLTQLAFQSFNI